MPPEDSVHFQRLKLPYSMYQLCLDQFPTGHVCASFNSTLAVSVSLDLLPGPTLGIHNHLLSLLQLLEC